ncbi:hypothetical protein [uncultured Roseibium sp.]|uniref:hypothetical protein n=1 Tax=uncultured Roseibium sp. TaxID=1936171 RepID=UPI003217E5B6
MSSLIRALLAKDGPHAQTDGARDLHVVEKFLVPGQAAEFALDRDVPERFSGFGHEPVLFFERNFVGIRIRVGQPGERFFQFSGSAVQGCRPFL